MAITSKQALSRVHNEGLKALSGDMPPGMSCGISPAGYRDTLASGAESLISKLGALVPAPALNLSLHFKSAAPDPTSPTHVTPTFDLKNTL